jgi:glucokinase
MNDTTNIVLAGDIGGTKSNLAIFSDENTLNNPIAQATFNSQDYIDLETLLKAFLDHHKNIQVNRAILGVAGPVINGEASITNLPWAIKEQALASTLGLESVHLLNDLLATAYAIPFLQELDIYSLHKGKPIDNGPIAIIAPGTGLGEAYMIWDGQQYQAYPSEGGHTDFAPINSTEIELLHFLQQSLEHVSYERVCSGNGLPNIYAFLKQKKYAVESDWVSKKLEETKDPTPIIIEAVLNSTNPCKLCKASLQLFVSILGAETGNLALKILSTGGVYLAGGLSPRLLPLLKHSSFLGSFRNKGRLAESLFNIPIHVILNSKAALLGAASYGFKNTSV